MTRLWIFLFLAIICGCSRPQTPEERRFEELVIIELASRLEEDYHRLRPHSTPTPK